MRIFVTVGNRTESFTRLVRMVDAALASLAMPYEGLFQAGTTPGAINGLERVSYLPRPQFEEEMRRADAVICHAGVGTLHSALEAGHLPIVIPRLASHGECVNDHQMEIVRALGPRVLTPSTAAALCTDLVRAVETRTAPTPLLPSAEALGPIMTAIDCAAPRWPRVAAAFRRLLSAAPRPRRIA